MPRPREIDDDVVLDAVGKVVGRGGPDAVTFARVAEAVGLSQATLVQRFGNKRGLLLATTIRGWNRLVGTFARTRRSHESPTEALLTALIGLTRGVRTRASLANSIAFLHIDLSDPEFHRHAVAGTIAMRERIEALLVEAIAAGELVPTDTKRLADAVQNAYNGALITWAMTDEGRLQDWLRSQIEFLLIPFEPTPAPASSSGSAQVLGTRDHRLPNPTPEPPPPFRSAPRLGAGDDDRIAPGSS